MLKDSVVPGLAPLRQARGLTREDVAGLLGVSYHSIYAWETGMWAPRLRFLIKLCRAFGVTPNDLLAYEIDPRDTRAQQLREGARRFLQ